jgi:RNA polymerase sigma-70 factor (ECF subfamily)
VRFRRRHIPETDEELVAAYKQTGDAEMVGKLYERYAQLVFLVCMKYLKDAGESEDAAMQVFEKLLTDLKKYEVRQFKGWLLTIVRNHCIYLLEVRKKQYQRQEALKASMDGVENDPAFDLTGDETELALGRMQEALIKLNDPQRICLDLFYLQKKSYQEVSLETGFTLKQVKSHIQNGKRNLKIMLSESGTDA